MKLPGTGSGPGPASSKVSGSAGLATGGGGAGGTTGRSDSVRRTVEDPVTRNALAGYAASPLPFSSPAGGTCVRISSSVWSWRW